MNGFLRFIRISILLLCLLLCHFFQASAHATESINGNDACDAAYSGTYTVGGSNPDFATLQMAVVALTSYGISGPVILKMRTGNYNSVSIIGNVMGADSINTITVMPDSGAKVAIFGNHSTADLILCNTTGWIFKGLTIGNATNGQIGVLMQGSVKHVTFRDCDILANSTSTDTNCLGVCYKNLSNSIFLTNVVFINNRIRGGYYNFHIHHMSGNAYHMTESSMTIDSNMLSDAYAGGIYFPSPITKAFPATAFPPVPILPPNTMAYTIPCSPISIAWKPTGST